MELDEVVEKLRPVGGYITQDEIRNDVELLIQADNPIEQSLERSHSVVDKIGEPDLLSINDVQGVDDGELERAIDEWDGIRNEMSRMYKTEAEYFEWECRRASLLEAIAETAAQQFNNQQSSRTERHRIVVEVNMWSSYAKHLLMEIDSADAAAAEQDHNILNIETQHDVNDAIMTTATIFESVGEQILARNHSHSLSSHIDMAETTDQLESFNYITTAEKTLVDEFRKNIRNSIAHDLFQRSRLNSVTNLRRDIVRPCWEIIDLSENLAQHEVAPDSAMM